MAARWPQSGSAVAYKIKDAWSSKIHVLYWAAGANSVHRLRSGDTASTIITRTAGSAGFNSTDGRITGNVGGTSTSVYFSDSITGGYGALTDSDAHTVIWGVYGSVQSSISENVAFFACENVGIFYDGFKAFVNDGYYGGLFSFKSNSGSFRGVGGLGGAAALVTAAARYDPADATAKQRVWYNGSEDTGFRNTTTVSGASVMGDASRPFYFGGSWYSSATSQIEWEFCAFGDGLSDADMATITSDPASIIEAVSASATITLTDPVAVVTGSTASCTITRSTAASGNITYNLTSSATGVATVPATATILDGQTTGSFNITGVSAGSSTITATNAADSGETDTATANVSALKGLTVTFGQTNLSGLTFAWFDQASPDLFAAPTVVGTTESTDGSGVMEIDLTGTSVAVGNTGFLLIYKAGATAPDDLAFFGRLAVEDIG